LLRAIAEVSIRRLAASELDLQLRAPDGRLRVRWSIATPRSFEMSRRELRGIIELVRGVTERSTVTRQSGRVVLEFEYGY
ncbi:MAG: hypothetical protein Q7J04_08280, partial [Microcella sp.]|nr:hypothetical protein [Microcella sp.]